MKEFKLTLNENWSTGCFGYLNNIHQIRILEAPKKKWYKKVLQFITFGLYQAPWEYKVELLSEQQADSQINIQKDEENYGPI